MLFVDIYKKVITFKNMRKKTLIFSILWLISLIATGTLGYIIIEKVSFMDALFMTVITITTIGYEQYIPLSQAGKIFTIVLALTGTGLFFYILANIGEITFRKFVENVWGKHMEKKIAKLKDHCILCGFGRIGKNIYEFIKDEIPVVVVEKNPRILKRLEEQKILYVAGEAFDEEVLLKAGIKRAKSLIAVLGEDAQNVYVILTARNLNPSIYIVARAENPKVAKKLLHAGANKVLSPYVIGARKMALALLKPNVMDFMELASPELKYNLQIEEMVVIPGSPLAGKTIIESNIRKHTNAIILAIKRASGEMIFNPTPDTYIQEGDTLIVLGEKEDLDVLAKIARGD